MCFFMYLLSQYWYSSLVHQLFLYYFWYLILVFILYTDQILEVWMCLSVIDGLKTNCYASLSKILKAFICVEIFLGRWKSLKCGTTFETLIFCFLVFWMFISSDDYIMLFLNATNWNINVNGSLRKFLFAIIFRFDN